MHTTKKTILILILYTFQSRIGDKKREIKRILKTQLFYAEVTLEEKEQRILLKSRGMSSINQLSFP